MYDQLPGSRRQSSAGHIRNFVRHDDDDPLLHERPEIAGPAAQGPASRTRGCALDDSDFDRRGKSPAPGDPGAEREARRLLHPRAHAERERGGSHRHDGKARNG